MSRWPAYPAYKDSGVEWLEEIPAHWDNTRLKYGYRVQLGKMLTPSPITDDDTLEPYLRSANVYWEGIDISDVKRMWFSPLEKSQYELLPGDLVVCEGGDVGRSAIWQGELLNCYIQNAVHRVRNRQGYSNKFLYYWLFMLKSGGYIDLICSKATIAHLTAEKLIDLPLIAPPFLEQRAIAAFLDRETAKLNALTGKFERLLDLLEERRAALISHAVTKGATHLRRAVEDRLPSTENAPLKDDPPSEVRCTSVEMQDSGIEWLGEIPAHWEVGNVKWLFTFLDSRRIPLSSEERAEMQGVYPYYGASGIIDYVNNYLFEEPLILVAGSTTFNRG